MLSRDTFIPVLLVLASMLAPVREGLAQAPEPRKTYYGRTIAQTMHFAGAGWLIRSTREREERSSLMLRQLGVKPGMTLCDMGCGNGFHTLRMAEMTGKTGRVYAVDVQPEMLQMLRARAEKAGRENITPILGSFYDPRLPDNQVDMILLVDVYHEFSYPERMLTAMRKSLKPNGVIVLVEFRTEDPDVPIKPLHKMSKAQLMKELPANGYKLVREYDGLPWQHLMFFGKDDSKAPKGESKAGESKAGESKAGESKAGESKAGESKAGESKAGESKAGESKAGDDAASPTKPGEDQSRETAPTGR